MARGSGVPRLSREGGERNVVTAAERYETTRLTNSPDIRNTGTFVEAASLRARFARQHQCPTHNRFENLKRPEFALGQVAASPAF